MARARCTQGIQSAYTGKSASVKPDYLLSREVFETGGINPPASPIKNRPTTKSAAISKPATDATHYSTIQGSNNDILGDIDTLTHAQITSDMTDNNDMKEG